MNEDWIARVKVWIERDFPNLSTTGYKITSPDTINYNCIAWAAGDDQRWWWPDSQNIDYWPEEVPREVTLDAFKQAFQTVGYEVCQTDSLESGWQKMLFMRILQENQHISPDNYLMGNGQVS